MVIDMASCPVWSRCAEWSRAESCEGLNMSRAAHRALTIGSSKRADLKRKAITTLHELVDLFPQKACVIAKASRGTRAEARLAWMVDSIRQEKTAIRTNNLAMFVTLRFAAPDGRQFSFRNASLGTSMFEGSQTTQKNFHVTDRRRDELNLTGRGVSDRKEHTKTRRASAGTRWRKIDLSGAKRALRSRGLLGLLGALLLDLLDLVDEIVGLLKEGGALIGGLHHIGLAAIEEVEVGHGVVIIGTELNGFLKVGDAFFDERTKLCSVVAAQGGGQGIGILHLLIDVVTVVSRAQLTIGTEGQGPIDDADPIIRLGISGLLLDVLLVVGLGLLKLFGIVGSAGHLEEDGADAVDSADIVGIDLQNFLEFIDRGRAEAHVLLRGRAGNVLSGVSSGQIETGNNQRGIEILGLLEILNGRVVQAVLEGGDTLVEKVASL